MTIADYYLSAAPYGHSWYRQVGGVYREEAFKAFMFAEIKKGEDNEVPLILVYAVNNSKDKTKFIAPIITNRVITKRQQLSAILKDFTIRLPSEYTVNTVVTNKGDIYHGGWGLILDKNMNPLYMESLILRDEKINGYLTTIPVGINFRISPKVFTEDGLIHKAISKNFIAGIAANEYTGLQKKVMNLTTHPRILKKNIIISDDNPFIIKPVMPKGININEELNSLLKAAV